MIGIDALVSFDLGPTFDPGNATVVKVRRSLVRSRKNQRRFTIYFSNGMMITPPIDWHGFLEVNGFDGNDEFIQFYNTEIAPNRG